MKYLKPIIIILTFIISIAFTSCIEDGFTTDSNHQPTFSVDTLKMGLVFTEAGTPTHSFMVYNRYDKMLNISSISFRDNNDIFRINVDGFSGKTFNNIEIRPNDSIFVFVEATLPPNGKNSLITIENHIDFITNGVTTSVVLSADGQDVNRKYGEVINTDTKWIANKPYQIFDSLIVTNGTTLTIEAGTTLYFHDNAYMRVDGTLISNGTIELPVNITGDRIDNVVSDIPFDLMSGQWNGIIFSTTSRNNYLTHTSIRNSVYGVIIDSIPSNDKPALYLLNCQLRNSMDYVLQSNHSDITAIGCEFAEAESGLIYLNGGKHIFNHCTISNNYLFAAIRGAAIQFNHLNADNDNLSGLPYTSAEFTNSIIYGIGSELSHGDLTGTNVYLRHCLLKSAGTDDDNFINCVWDADPLFYTIREEYIFDYRLKDQSPAIAVGNPDLTLQDAMIDRYGLNRGDTPDIGAYVYTPEEKTEE